MPHTDISYIPNVLWHIIKVVYNIKCGLYICITHQSLNIPWPEHMVHGLSFLYGDQVAIAGVTQVTSTIITLQVALNFFFFSNSLQVKTPTREPFSAVFVLNHQITGLKTCWLEMGLDIWNLGTHDFRYDFALFFIYMNSYMNS